MTQEDKQLLLKDLCARLPYSVILNVTLINKYDNIVNRDIELTDDNLTYITRDSHWIMFKPYLRPMSSMTEEERDEYSSFVLREHDGYLTDGMPDYTGKHYVYTDNVNIFIDWLNKKMFDYRGLIEKGLALEAPKEMYN